MLDTVYVIILCFKLQAEKHQKRSIKLLIIIILIIVIVVAVVAVIITKVVKEGKSIIKL